MRNKWSRIEKVIGSKSQCFCFYLESALRRSAKLGIFVQGTGLLTLIFEIYTKFTGGVRQVQEGVRQVQEAMLPDPLSVLQTDSR